MLEFTNPDMLPKPFSRYTHVVAAPEDCRGAYLGESRRRGGARHPDRRSFHAECHPLPMKGILVAITVMNCTLASSGRLAM